ncbi:DoxX family protein [Candidatus Gracilibacteria bacterium]|nr:DoxX family protein [Candidatus Gracilibacteria bacterium]
MASVSKKVKITFWVSTILVAFFTVPSIFVVNLPSSIEMFNHLGVGADWFRWELEAAKTIAGLILLAPFIKGRIKEWAYVGLGIDFISAGIALGAVDGIAAGVPILLFVAILAVSYISYHKIQGTKTPWY